MGSSSLLNHGSEPLYRQLEKKIRDDINSGVYPVHSKIPSEMELCERYAVSRVTVRKALAELIEEGLLIPQQGRGTFVGIPALVRNLKSINSFHDTCRMIGAKAGAKLLKAHTVAASGDDMEKLGVAENEKVVEIIRVRTADELPVMLEINHFPEKFSYLISGDLSGSIYDILESRGTVIGQGIHEISLFHATPMQAEQLHVKEGEALLRLKETIYDSDGQPLHTSDQFIRGDRFTFRI